MIRSLVFLVIIALLAFGAVWVADRPGDVVVTWLGHRIETSVMVVAVALAAVAAVTTMLWSLVRAIVRSPGRLLHRLRSRRGVRGYLAVSRGLVAVGSGDVVAARR